MAHGTRTFLALFLTHLMVAVGFPVSTAYAEYYGRFLSQPTGQFLRESNAPRSLFRLSEDLQFEDPNGLFWTAPAGEVVDGASIPAFVWILTGGPFGQLHTPAAIIHDYYCCARNRNFDDTHRAFHRGLLAEGVSPLMARAMYWAVAIAGPGAWTVTADEAPPTPCRELGEQGRVIHNNYEYLTQRERKILVAKHFAMVRTYAATQGRLIDVVHGIPIPAEGAATEAHLATLQKAVRLRFAEHPVADLGLFTAPLTDELKGFEQVRGWQPGQIAEIDAFMKSAGLSYTSHSQAPRLVADPLNDDFPDIPKDIVQ